MCEKFQQYQMVKGLGIILVSIESFLAIVELHMPNFSKFLEYFERNLEICEILPFCRVFSKRW
jgi:hypothetical protein